MLPTAYFLISQQEYKKDAISAQANDLFDIVEFAFKVERAC